MSATIDPKRPAKKMKKTDKKEEPDEEGAALQATRKAMPKVLVIKEDTGGQRRGVWATPMQIADRILLPQKASQLWAKDMRKANPGGSKESARSLGTIWDQKTTEARAEYEKKAAEDVQRYEEECRSHWAFYDAGLDFYVYK